MKKFADIFFRTVLVLLSWLLFSVVGLFPAGKWVPGYDKTVGKQVEKFHCSRYVFPKFFFEENFFNNGNLANGGKVFIWQNKVYVNHDKKIYCIEGSGGRDTVVMEDADEGIVFNGEDYFYEVKEGKIHGAFPVGTLEMNYDWRKKYSKKDGTIDYNKLYGLAASFDGNKLSLKKEAALIGFAREQVIIGRYKEVMFFGRQEEDGIHILRQDINREDNIREMGVVHCHGPIVCVDGFFYCITKDRRSVCRVRVTDLSDIEEIFSKKKGKKIQYINAVSTDSGSYVAFNRGKKLYLYGMEDETKAEYDLTTKGEIEGIYCQNNICYVKYKDVLAKEWFVYGEE